MEIETTPEQPDEVGRLLAALLEPEPREPDPWWQAGIEDALGQ